MSTTSSTLLPLSSDEAAQLTVDQVVERLQSRIPRGISDAEADRRHEEFGFNEFDIGEEESMLANYVSIASVIRAQMLEVQDYVTNNVC